MKFPSIKICYFFGFIVCAAMIGFALHLEYADNLLPCPLCQLQRIVLGIIGILFFLAMLTPVKRITILIYGFTISVFSTCGFLLAGRQIYLQHLPSGVQESCGAGLSYLFKVFSVNQALMMAIKGTGECAKVVWRFLGLNIAEWSFIVFVLLAVLALVQIARIRKI